MGSSQDVGLFARLPDLLALHAPRLHAHYDTLLSAQGDRDAQRRMEQQAEEEKRTRVQAAAEREAALKKPRASHTGDSASGGGQRATLRASSNATECVVTAFDEPPVEAHALFRGGRASAPSAGSGQPPILTRPCSSGSMHAAAAANARSAGSGQPPILTRRCSSGSMHAATAANARGSSRGLLAPPRGSNSNVPPLLRRGRSSAALAGGLHPSQAGLGADAAASRADATAGRGEDCGKGGGGDRRSGANGVCGVGAAKASGSAPRGSTNIGAGFLARQARFRVCGREEGSMKLQGHASTRDLSNALPEGMRHSRLLTSLYLDELLPIDSRMHSRAVLNAGRHFNARHSQRCLGARTILQALQTPSPLEVSAAYRRALEEVQRNRLFVPEVHNPYGPTYKPGKLRVAPAKRWCLDESIWHPRKVSGNSRDYYETDAALRAMFEADWVLASVGHGLSKAVVKADCTEGHPPTWVDIDGNGVHDSIDATQEALWLHRHVICARPLPLAPPCAHWCAALCAHRRTPLCALSLPSLPSLPPPPFPTAHVHRARVLRC